MPVIASRARVLSMAERSGRGGRQGSCRAADPTPLETARVGPAELIDVQDAPVLQVDPQCTGRPDRGVAFHGRRSRRFHCCTATRSSSEIHRGVESIALVNSCVCRARAHPATPFRDGTPCRNSGSFRRPFSCQGPPSRLERAGERGTLVRVFPHRYFYAPPDPQWITSSPEVRLRVPKERLRRPAPERRRGVTRLGRRFRTRRACSS